MDLRRMVAPALAVALLTAVGAGVLWSNRSVKDDARQRQDQQAEQSKQAHVRGVIGSEKEAFFADDRVKKALLVHGLTVTVQKAGSRTIVDHFNPTFDFGFPSGAPAAQHLKARAKATQVFSPFYTPMVIASWRPIAEILVANGIAQKQGDVYYLVDMPKLIEVISQGKRWRELKNSAGFSTSKAVLVSSTDVRTSNSAAMYLALASYVANGEQVVQSAEDVAKVIPVVAPLFLRQGLQEQSSSGPFEDYLALGMGKAPMLISYESQLVEYFLRHPDKVKGDMVLMYPKPTVFSKHVVVPYTPNGARLGAVLESDPALRELAHEFGFRTGGEKKGPEVWATRGVKVPDVLVDAIEPPSHEWLERLIGEIEQRFK